MLPKEKRIVSLRCVIAHTAIQFLNCYCTASFFELGGVCTLTLLAEMASVPRIIVVAPGLGSRLVVAFFEQYGCGSTYSEAIRVLAGARERIAGQRVRPRCVQKPFVGLSDDRYDRDLCMCDRTMIGCF